jgi:hypothetical protein
MQISYLYLVAGAETQTSYPIWLTIVKLFAGQWLALVTFFLFPVIQYCILWVASRRKGQPELWYLPAYGFRLVIRNLPHKKILTDIKYRIIVRSLIPGSEGSSVATLVDRPVLANEDMVLFPKTDQILLSFNLRDNNNASQETRPLVLVVTDKTGSENSSVPLSLEDRLLCDYTATIHNPFSFNVQTGKRVEIDGDRILEIYEEVKKANVEQRFTLSRVRNIY